MPDPILTAGFAAMLVLIAIAWARVFAYLVRSYMVRPRGESS